MIAVQIRCIVHSANSMLSGAAWQTMPYMPPELLEHSQLTPAVDTYSFGMIMWECFTDQASPLKPSKTPATPLYIGL